MNNKITEKSLNEKKKIDSLKNDVIFKAFFSRKGNEEFLIDFLKGLLKIDIKEIIIRDEVSLEKLNREEKAGRLDLQAKLDNGTIVNIEMQLKNEHNIEERTTFYSSKVISKETKRGTKYKDIEQVIMINILDYEMLGFDEYISETAIVLDKHREYELLKGIKWYFIELPKFRKQHPDMNEKVNQWLAVIDNYDKGLIKVAQEKNKKIKSALDEIGVLTGDEEVQRLAELREKWEMDRASTLYYGETVGIEKANQEVLKQLINLGKSYEEIMQILQIPKGEEHIIKEMEEKLGTNVKEQARLIELREKWEKDRASEIGYAKKEEREEIVKEMIKKGIDLETIIEVAKITKEEIEQIKGH